MDNIHQEIIFFLNQWKQKSFYYCPKIENITGRDLQTEVWIEFCSHRKTKNLTPKSTWFKKNLLRTTQRVWKRIQRAHKRHHTTSLQSVEHNLSFLD